MASGGKRLVVLSFDGLSSRQFEQLLEYTPFLRQTADNLAHAQLNSRPFTAAAPIWAELLTGKPWFENGCVGYAQPQRSLNHVHVMTERDLDQPVLPLYRQRKGACINLPLLLPADNRAWLSDGSMPITGSVAPAALAKEELFSTYQARAFDSLPFAAAMTKLSTPRCLESERIRLRCAQKLSESSAYEWLLLRFSVFDELQHFFGDAWLDEPGLWFAKELQEFLKFADDKLRSICSNALVFILSAFSHEPCKATANLNLILRQGNFLEMHQDQWHPAKAREEAKRAEAIEAITGMPVRKERLQSMQGLLIAENTVAASPLAGCVYLNETRLFADGCVSEADRQSVVQSLGAFLQAEMKKKYQGQFELFCPPAARSSKPLPECIVCIDNTLMTDALDPLSAKSRSGTMHAPDGFLYGPASVLQGQSSLSLTAAGQMIGECV